MDRRVSFVLSMSERIPVRISWWTPSNEPGLLASTRDPDPLGVEQNDGVSTHQLNSEHGSVALAEVSTRLVAPQLYTQFGDRRRTSMAAGTSTRPHTDATERAQTLAAAFKLVTVCLCISTPKLCGARLILFCNEDWRVETGAGVGLSLAEPPPQATSGPRFSRTRRRTKRSRRLYRNGARTGLPEQAKIHVSGE